jgi:ABC-2 type transport system permease protein
MTTTLTRETINNSPEAATVPPRNSIPAARTAADSIKAIPTTLNAEWIKLRSLRSNTAILGLAAVIGGFVSWAIATYVTDEVLTVVGVFGASTVFTAVFASVAGILLFTSESQHGTLGPALTAQPARAVIAGSKTVLAAAFGATLGAVGLAAGYLGAWITSIPVGDTSAILSTVGWAIGFSTLAAVLGLGIGMITRMSTAAVSGLLVWWLVVENLVSLFLAERFVRFMPFTAGNNMISAGPQEEITELALSGAENALVFGGYAAAALTIGTVLLYRRDTN